LNNKQQTVQQPATRNKTKDKRKKEKDKRQKAEGRRQKKNAEH